MVLQHEALFIAENAAVHVGRLLDDAGIGDGYHDAVELMVQGVRQAEP